MARSVMPKNRRTVIGILGISHVGTIRAGSGQVRLITRLRLSNKPDLTFISLQRDPVLLPSCLLLTDC
jgi:hypothetical protein